jgi:hypothetical protein
MSNTTSLLSKFENETLTLNQMANLKGGEQSVVDGKTACIDRTTTDYSCCGCDVGFHCHMDDGSYKFYWFNTATI